jgi:3-oxoacyl-[acyl-carrier-protein] synthase II
MSGSAAITGWAWRTPLGNSVDDVLRRLLAGERAARQNPRFDAAAYACTLAASIGGEPGRTRHSRFLRRMGLFALEVATEALAHSGVKGGDRLGLFFGYGGLRAHWNDMMPALQGQAADGEDSWERGFKLLHPFWMLQHLSNNAQALAAEELSARGDGVTFGGANAGAQALAGAIRALEVEAVDAALVVGHDTLLAPETLVELGARGAATTRGSEGLAAPYDRDAEGFVPGEAAAALLLRRPSDVEGRRLASVEADDGADGERGEPAGSVIGGVARRLLRGDEVIDGAGRATLELDLAERSALAEYVDRAAPMCCTFSAMGQVGAAASLVQTIALAELLRRKMLPPIAGLRHVADGPLRPLSKAEPTAARAAMGISTGAPGLVGIVRVEVP